MNEKPIKTAIQIELLKFADGLGHVLKCVTQGSLSTDEANRLKNKLAGVYADHIARVIQEDEYPDRDETMPEGAALLADFGVEPLTAKHLAAECSLDDIKGWIAYAEAQSNLTSPQGLVVSRLRAGVPAPKPPKRKRGHTDWRDYLIHGEYAEYIQT